MFDNLPKKKAWVARRAREASGTARPEAFALCCAASEFHDVYDQNDRLLAETLDSNGDGSIEQTTICDYSNTNLTSISNDGSGHLLVTSVGEGTSLIAKSVWQGGDFDTINVRHASHSLDGKLSETSYTYNVQGRMVQVDVNSDGDGDIDSTSSYEYDANGTRISETVDGVKTSFLVDHQNPTGYSQTLEEKRDLNENDLLEDNEVVKTYTLGLDIIAQQAPSEQSGGTLYLLKDGHSSTRGLVDALGNPLTSEIYRYDAFGNAIGFNPANALTFHLFNSEAINAKTGLYDFRFRPYDPVMGRFFMMDGFAGKMEDPLTLHKYLFCHGDGINFTDPTGLMFIDDWSAQGMAAHVGFSIWAKLQRPHAETGIELGSMFEDLNGFGYGLLKPDLVDPVSREYFELKPARHADKPSLQAIDALQMLYYDIVLGIQRGYHRGDSTELVKPSLCCPAVGNKGVLIGELITPTEAYTLSIWPAEDPMSVGGHRGKGFVWYEVKKYKRSGGLESVPAKEEVKVYKGEEVKVRIWEPYVVPVAQAFIVAGVLTCVVATIYAYMPSAMMSLAALKAALGGTG